MRVFIDTSALHSVFDRDDNNHRTAGLLWQQLIEHGHDCITTNYVLVETGALLQSRLAPQLSPISMTKLYRQSPLSGSTVKRTLRQ